MRALVLVFLYCTLTHANAAQVTLRGKILDCPAANKIVFDESISQTAYYGDGIRLNRRKLLKLKPEVQWFAFYHECAHASGVHSEIEADTFAAKIGVEQGWFTEDKIDFICESWGKKALTSAYPKPSERCQNLRQLLIKPQPIAPALEDLPIKTKK